MLESKLYFSTLEYANFLDSPTDLFGPCVRQLEEEWNDICEAAESHLSNTVWESKACLAGPANQLVAKRDISFQWKKSRPNKDTFERCANVD
jgi:hypothetical protein